MSERSVPTAADLFGDLLEIEAPQRTGLASHLPGLMLAGVAALAAAYLSEHYGAPLMLMGLLIGLAFNFANADTRLHPGLNFASKSLLRWGIVLVGAQVTLQQIADLGVGALAVVAAMIALVTAAGWATARSLRLGAGLGILAGGAVAICGASAALALSALLGEKRSSQAQLTLVLVAVAAASALAMSTYPVIAGWLGFSDRQAGFLIGASIHDVAQALGAGYSVSPEVGETAAIVKLTRVTLLAPTLLILSAILTRDGSGKNRVGIPWFVIGFLGLAVVNSLWPLPERIVGVLGTATSALLVVAVVATGIRSPMNLLLQQGWRASMPVVVATIVALLLAIGGAFLLY